MKLISINGLTLYCFKNLCSYSSLFQAISTRTCGASKQPFKSFNLGLNTKDTYDNILLNHVNLSKALEFDLHSLVSSRQVHGRNIITIDRKPVTTEPFTLQYTFDGFDALTTDQPGTTLIIRVADCVPIILFDAVNKILSVVHAGWKGTLEGISAHTVKKMINHYKSNASDIIAGIGPSIGQCCFAVQKDVADLFYNRIPNAHMFIKEKNMRTFINLGEANRLQLTEQGIKKENIEVADVCTSCNSHIFFSHRKEQGQTGRFGLVAGLK